MTTGGRERLVHGQVAWMLSAIFVLSVLGQLSLPIFFVCTFVGFLIMIELTAPVTVTPKWRARLKWFVILGLILLGYILIKKMLSLLGSGIVP